MKKRKDASYLEAYAAHTDQRVEESPHEAVGGMWEEIGQLQFTYLVRKGLSPHHRLLDIGCGTLRGGRYFVRFLQPGNYTGTDISLSAIEWGRQLIATEGLADKLPQLIHRRAEDPFFLNFEQEGFDFILAQSVFTHLPPAIIDQCFASVGGVMRPQAVFYFTFKEAAKPIRTGLKDFRYPNSFFAELAERHRFHFELHTDYDHPRGQRMLSIRRPT